MSWIVDLIIVGIIGIFIFLGYKRGLTGSILKILSFVIALVIAIILFKPVSNFVIESTLIDEKIEESIISIVEEDVNEEGKIEEENTNLPQSMVNYINESIENATDDLKRTVIEQTARDIAIAIINAAVALIVFIVARFVLIFVKVITNLITELPIIKQVDKLGGVIYGLVAGLLVVFIIFAIISFISPLIESTGLLVTLNKSVLGSHMYNNNLLLKIIF